MVMGLLLVGNGKPRSFPNNSAQILWCNGVQIGYLPPYLLMYRMLRDSGIDRNFGLHQADRGSVNR
jgi:hypothetical protein